MIFKKQWIDKNTTVYIECADGVWRAIEKKAYRSHLTDAFEYHLTANFGHLMSVEGGEYVIPNKV